MPDASRFNHDAGGFADARTTTRASERDQTNFVALDVSAWIAIACCIASLGLYLMTLIVSLPYGDPNAPPLFEIIVYIGIFMILPAMGLAGAVSMLTRRRYALSLAGACCLLVPVLGPCFGLALPVGVWMLLLLWRQQVRESFSPLVKASPNGYDNADDVLAAASKLDRNGDWDAAIALYRSAAGRWPEHSQYVENCVKEIEKKQDAAS